MASPGHRANILSRSFRHMGVGYARSYWAMDLGGSRTERCR